MPISLRLSSARSRPDCSSTLARATAWPVVPLPAHDLLLRLLNNVRALAVRQPPGLDAAAMRLWAVELSLLLPRHPVSLRRERGEGMTDEQVVRFVDAYYPAYELYLDGVREGVLPERPGSHLRLVVGRDRSVQDHMRL